MADLALENRWGDYRSQAQLLGVRSLLCEPMIDDGTVVGVLTLYSGAPSNFAPDLEPTVRSMCAAITERLRTIR